MSLIKVTVIDREGTSHELDAPTDMGMNMMELCKSAELPVEGTCGGMAMCASCHMYVQSDHAIPDKSDDEEDMLDEAFHVTDESRLGCQPLGRRPRRVGGEAGPGRLMRPEPEVLGVARAHPTGNSLGRTNGIKRPDVARAMGI